MKDTIILFSIGIGMVVCSVILAVAYDRSQDVIGIGECVESNSYIEGFQGTSKEKWEVFADYCRKNK